MSPALQWLWDRCVPSDTPMPQPGDEAYQDQTNAHRLGIVFRHRGDLRPEGYPRVFHSQGAYALVSWTPRVALGGPLARPQIALARFSNTPEPRMLQVECGRTPLNDYLIGVALKFFDDGAPEGARSVANLLFVTDPDGMQAPEFFQPATRLSTRSGRVDPDTKSVLRPVLELAFQEAVDLLRKNGFEHPPAIDELPVAPLVGQDLRARALELVPRVQVSLPGGSDFLRTLTDHPTLCPGATLYDVAALDESGERTLIAVISLSTRFRISIAGDELLFFPHASSSDPPVADADLAPAGFVDAKLRERAEETDDEGERARARALIMLATGHSIDLVARSTGESRDSVRALRDDYAARGLDALRKPP
ncbi:hypothetical protein [Sandaracinus amylolyticus]|uniref:hypothetical protein n=1 Tax=Sandaracinus amylolyticus TaxID=927083 RepID=UPI001F48DE37|nr:hypothetical protein [Sandaracinus amylolyticus]